MDIINLSYLKLMADGDADMESIMLDMLLEELPAEFDKMKALTAAQDWAELSKVSHKMKSTLAFVGNEDMTQANLIVEQLTKNREIPLSEDEQASVSTNMARFESLLPSVMGELRRVALG